MEAKEYTHTGPRTGAMLVHRERTRQFIIPVTYIAGLYFPIGAVAASVRGDGERIIYSVARFGVRSVAPVRFYLKPIGTRSVYQLCIDIDYQLSEAPFFNTRSVF